MQYTITLSGQSYTLATSSDAETAAVTACRTRRNEAMGLTVPGDPVTNEDGTTTTPQVPNPDLFATDEAYLQSVYTNWATGNPGFTADDLQTSWLGALASWTGQSPPDVILQQPELTGDALKTALKAYAAAKRYQVETGGMTVNGVQLPTDRETQSKLSGAVVAFQAGALTGTIDWKAASGWVSVDQATVTALASAVAMHVQSAFSKEKAVSEAIDAETITTKSQIDNFAW